MRLNMDRIATAAVGIMLGAAAVVSFGVVLSPSDVPMLSAIATSLAVIVALFVGFMPWLMARSERYGKAVVMANILGDELIIYRNSLSHVVGCLGVAAETNDHEMIRRAAESCLPDAPDTFKQYLKDVDCFSGDSACVSRALKSVIDVVRSVDLVARAPLEELVANSGHDAYRQIARQAVSRAMKAGSLIEQAILVAERFGAVFQERSGDMLTESPVPDFAEMVRVNGGPIDPANCVLDPPAFPGNR
jgi:hypothetical protein